MDDLCTDATAATLGCLLAAACLVSPWFAFVAIPITLTAQRALLLGQLESEAQTDPKTSLTRVDWWRRRTEEMLRAVADPARADGGPADRHRPLQAGQRPARPPGRRRGAARGRDDPAQRDPGEGRDRPVRWRGVRHRAAGHRDRRRDRHRRPAPQRRRRQPARRDVRRRTGRARPRSGHLPADRLDRRRRLPRRRHHRRRPAAPRRPGDVRRQGRRPQPRPPGRRHLPPPHLSPRPITPAPSPRRHPATAPAERPGAAVASGAASPTDRR